ncbi:MAG: acyl-CoA dehydrogenase [Deltaproteobacteria bacterium]|nr:acyl-CoA dehydrogenase [Deltaproteobacteria bacterium]
MDFSLTEDQNAIRDLARSILEDRATDERVKQLAADPEWYDLDLWRDLARASLLGVALPEEHGGGGFGLLELCLVCEEAGRRIAPLPLLPTLVLGALPIAEFGSPAQKRAFLPDVVSGELFLTAALTEIGGTDPSRPRTTARRSGSGWVLDGEKACVPAADRAARIVVPAQADDGAVAVFLVDPKATGVGLSRETTTNGEPQFGLALRGVQVGDDDVLGDPRAGAGIARWIETRGLVAICALQLGIADGALRRTAAYVSERKQFDRAIGTFQAVQMRAADAFIDVEAIRSTLYQAVWAVAEERDAARAVEVAKWWACRAGHRVAHAAQHLHGGIGADLEYPIHRFFLWAKQNEYALGGASPHLARLGAMLVQGE